MNKEEGRITALKWALYFIFALIVLGAGLLIYQHFVAGAILLGAAGISLAHIARA